MFGVIDIEKALDSTTASGTALIPQVIDPYIGEFALQVAPTRTLIPRTPWKSGTYDRNKRTAFGLGRFAPDGSTISETNSTIVRFQEPLKIIQAKGGVTGFLQASSQELLDALNLEVNGHIMSSVYTEEFGNLFGNKKADTNQYDGFDTWIGTNVSDVNDVWSFKRADDMIDAVNKRGGKPGFFTMSHTMQSFFSRLLVSQQRFVDEIEIRAGVKLKTYRNIPIYPTTSLQANQAWTGGTVTAAAATSGGSLADGAYFYKVSAVLITGETLPATEATATVSGGGGNGKVTLTFTAPVTANSVMLYKIYRSQTTGTEVFYTVIPGMRYSTAADLIGSLTLTDISIWVDTGVRTSQTVAGVTVTGANYTPTTAQAVPPLGSNQENVFLISTDVPGVQGYATHTAVLKELGYLPLAKIADKEWFLILQYSVLIMLEIFSARSTRVTNQ